MAPTRSTSMPLSKVTRCIHASVSNAAPLAIWRAATYAKDHVPPRSSIVAAHITLAAVAGTDSPAQGKQTVRAAARDRARLGNA
jgi:hypothetical protein